jgi:hypothetical protein
MRTDIETIPFSAKATTETLADIDLLDAEAMAVLVEITAHGGTATNAFVDLVPRMGTSVPVATALSDAIGHPADLTNTTGIVALTRIGPHGAAKTTVMGDGFMIPRTFRQARVRATLVGAGHTITGNVYVMRVYR